MRLECSDSWVESISPALRNMSDIGPGGTTIQPFAIKVNDQLVHEYFNLKAEVLSYGYKFWEVSKDSGIVTGIHEESVVPLSFKLEQNYPNPFNPTTKIKYSIPSSTETRHALSVQLKIYDILGRELATLVNETKAPGNYEIEFNATALPSGVYFYTIKAGSYMDTKKMVLLK
jgi:hypothetical protein